MKTISTNATALILAVAILIASAVYLIKPSFPAIGAAFTGQSAFLQVATTTTLSNPGNTALFAANDTCKSRVITTTSAGIWLAFDGTPAAGPLSSTTVAINNGHYQATNTTQVYDSGLYGCQDFIATSSAVTAKVITSEF